MLLTWFVFYHTVVLYGMSGYTPGVVHGTHKKATFGHTFTGIRLIPRQLGMRLHARSYTFYGGSVHVHVQ